MKMSEENEYLKLLANKIFWAAIGGAITISVTLTAFYFGIKIGINDLKSQMVLEIRDLKSDQKLRDQQQDNEIDKKQDKNIEYTIR